MAKEKFKKIGIVVHNIHDEYSNELLQGLEDYCTKRNERFFIFLASPPKADSRLEENRHVASYYLINKSNIDGLILSSGTLTNFISIKDFIDSLKEFSGLPVVSIATKIPGIPLVVGNEEIAFKKMVTHLITKHKCKKFLLFRASTKSNDSSRRCKWFLETLEKYNLKIDAKNIFNASFRTEPAEALLTKYLKKNGKDFDAIVCVNDLMAIGCMNALKAFNLRIPEDVVVTGFDNDKVAISYTPPLTSIDPKISFQAQKAAQIIDLLIDKKTKESVKPICYEGEGAKEKYRCSCGCLPKNQIAYNAIDDDGVKDEISSQTIFQSLHGNQEIQRLQFLAITYLLEESQSVLSLEELFSRIPKYLQKLNISALVIASYKEPIYIAETYKFSMPEEINRLYVYDENKENPESKKVLSFNPRLSMLPKNTLSDKNKKLLVYTLFENDYQYGYIVAALKDSDYLFYEIAFEALSKEITSSLKFTNEEKAKEKLIDDNLSLENYSNKLSNIANTDELTHILNRRGFMMQAKTLIDDTISEGKKGLVIYGDIDNLKKINDNYGHDAGDRAIKMEARIIKGLFRKSDILGRLGGDEFAIVASYLTSDRFNYLKMRIEEECESFNKRNVEQFTLSISLGYTEFGKDKSDLETLLEEADKAQYIEKQRKKKGREQE